MTLRLDNPTDRALFQLGRLPTKLRTTIIHHGPCRPKGEFAIRGENTHFLLNTLPCTLWGNGNRTAMALHLTNDEEIILSKLLEELRNEDQITRENPLDASIAFGRWKAG